MQDFDTEQEAFWAGEFGQGYVDRNKSEQLLTAKTVMWAQILRAANGVTSVKELGCNIGLNLQALRRLNPDLALSAVEINEAAAAQAQSLNIADINVGTILDELDHEAVDLTFTAGVLIHINPDRLSSVYDNLYKLSRRYVVVAEYYNPSPVSVNYRGNQDKLFKRDFAGDLIDNYGMKLIDYGFLYHRDTWAPQDDMTWFLLEK
jgi:pseudaminic acid biosynthesis-associated methylase